jgi:TPR repeat protein
MSCKVCKIPTTLQCAGCHDVNYCGKACQRADFKEHKDMCLSTPLDIKGKKARKLFCATCDGDLQVLGIEECVGCRSTRYCSLECQKKHWKNGHRAVCATRGAIVFKECEKTGQHFNLAQLYKYGTGTASDANLAFEALKTAAASGDAQAMNNIGMMYHEGDGVAKDNEEATVWLRAAALAGNITGYHNLGVVYKEISQTQMERALESDGAFIEQALTSLRRSFESFKKAAEEGCAHSYGILAGYFRSGLGCVADQERAEFWGAMC